MFDLFRSRQKAVRYVLSGILLLIAVSMVVTLIPGYGSSSATNTDNQVLAEIGSTKITAQEMARDAQRMLGGRMPPDMVETYLPQFIDSRIQQSALVYEFERMGIAATDDEVLWEMMSQFPQLFPNGVLTDQGKNQLEAMLAQQGMTLQDMIDASRSAMTVNKIQNLEYEAAVVTPQEVDAELTRRYDKAKIRYIAFPAAKFHDQVKPSPAEIKAYYDSHRYQYTDPEKRSFEVVVIDQDTIEKSIAITDVQLHAAYSQNMDSFRTPERVHVRHILVKTLDKSDAEKKQLLTKAQDVMKQVKSGADFGDLARKYSEDAADKGGDIGWVVHGQTVAEFEKAAFALKPKETSGIVTTTYGYHIIQVLEREPARVKPFDEVKASLADQLKKNGLSEKMQTVADQVHAALEKAPGSAADVAKQFGVQEISVSKAAPGEAIPGLGVTPEIDGALNSLQKNGVTPVLTLPANRIAVAVLTDKIAPRPADFSESETKARDALIALQSISVADKKAKEAAERLKAGEDLDKVAKSMKLDVTDSADFSRNDSVEGLGHAALVPDAFSKPVGTIVGPNQIAGRSVVFKIVDQKHADTSTLGKERAMAMAELKKRKGVQDNALFMDSVITKLTAEGKVKIHHDAIKRFVASFHQ
jgi:peptidyl-prolyl cis-trans isomerase D